MIQGPITGLLLLNIANVIIDGPHNIDILNTLIDYQTQITSNKVFLRLY